MALGIIGKQTIGRTHSSCRRGLPSPQILARRPSWGQTDLLPEGSGRLWVRWAGGQGAGLSVPMVMPLRLSGYPRPRARVNSSWVSRCPAPSAQGRALLNLPVPRGLVHLAL